MFWQYFAISMLVSLAFWHFHTHCIYSIIWRLFKR